MVSNSEDSRKSSTHKTVTHIYNTYSWFGNVRIRSVFFSSAGRNYLPFLWSTRHHPTCRSRHMYSTHIFYTCMCLGVCANIGHHSTSSAIGVASLEDRHQYTEWLHPVPPELQPIQKEICWLTEHSHTYTHTYMSHLPHHKSGGKCALSLRIIQLMVWDITLGDDSDTRLHFTRPMPRRHVTIRGVAIDRLVISSVHK